MALGLNSHHDSIVINYLKLTRFQRSQFLKSIDSTFQEIKDKRLQELTYTVEEIEDILTDLRLILSGDVESELIASVHTNVLLLRQAFQQAQKWHLNLEPDLAELENRDLLDEVKRWEDAEVASSQAKRVGSNPDLDRPPVLCPVALSRNQPLGGKLAPLAVSRVPPGGGIGELLQSQVSSLKDENEKLRQKVKEFEVKSLISSDEDNEPRASLLDIQRQELEVKNSEVEELNEAFKAVKQQMVAELEASTAIKDILESDLMSTKQALMEAQSHLILAEKELERKFSQTGAYKNLKKLLAQKNDQIRELRAELTAANQGAAGGLRQSTVEEESSSDEAEKADDDIDD